MSLFATEFDEPENYRDQRPSDQYALRLLGKEHIIHLGAVEDGRIIGGLVAYVLEKFEQERSEIYIYDLAVSSAHRRKKVATNLINSLRGLMEDFSAWVIFVQADYGDTPAIKLYESLGIKEEVLHFDIPKPQ